MAREPYQPFPTVTPQETATPQINARATPTELGAGVGQAEEQAGAALGRAGQAATNVGLQFRQLHNQTLTLNATTQAAQDIGALDTDFRIKNQGSAAYQNYPKFQQSVADIGQKYAGGFTGEAKEQFLAEFKSRQLLAEENMSGFVADQSLRANVQAKQSAVNLEVANATRNAIMSGAAPDFSNIVAAVSHLGASMNWSRDQTTDAIQQATGKVVSGVAAGMIARSNPNDFNRSAQVRNLMDVMLKQNIPGTDAPYLPGNEAARISQEIQNLQWTDALRQQQAQERGERQQMHAAAKVRVGLDRTLSSATAIIDNGQSATAALANLTDKDIDGAFPQDPDLAAQVKGQVADLKQTSAFLDRLPGMTPPQIAQLAASVPRPDPNDPATYRSRLRTETALTRALHATDKALRTDPAAFVVQSHPDIAQLGAAAEKDPSHLPAYAAAVLGIQKQMGVPDGAQHLLTAPAAQALAQKVTADPAAAHKTMQDMQAAYGPYWGDVMHDMVTLGKLPPAFQAVADIQDPTQAMYLARALSAGKGEGKDIRQLVPDAATKGTTSVPTILRTPGSPAMQFLGALEGAGASDAMKASLLNAMETLAYGNMIYAGVSNPGDAAQAAESAFVGHYDSGLLGRGLLVPTDNAPAVQGNLRATLSALNDRSVAIPPIFGQPEQPGPGEYLAAVRAAPTWKMAPSGDAAWLYDPEGRLVRLKNGQPVAVSFNAPLMAGATIGSPDVEMNAAAAEAAHRRLGAIHSLGDWVHTLMGTQ